MSDKEMDEFLKKEVDEIYQLIRSERSRVYLGSMRERNLKAGIAYLLGNKNRELTQKKVGKLFSVSIQNVHDGYRRIMWFLTHKRRDLWNEFFSHVNPRKTDIFDHWKTMLLRERASKKTRAHP